MATVMLMHWPEVSLDQYEQARKEVNWEGDTPKGAKFDVMDGKRWFSRVGSLGIP